MRAFSRLLRIARLVVVIVLAAACGRADDAAAVEVRPVAQTSGTREPLFLVRCRGGGAHAHYKWTLASGLRAVPSVVDQPTLLVQTKLHAGPLEARCVIEQEGDKPRTAVGTVQP